MGNVTNLRSSVLQKAKAELEKEKVEVAVGKLKALYRKQDQAQLVLENINREIADYEARVEQGDV